MKPEQINKNISENHFLFLPTFNENFGHVIVESFKAGCPVIISDQTPWKNLSEKKVGWELPLSNEKAFIETLVYCGKMGNEEFASFSQASYAYAMEIVDNQDVLKQNIDLFSNI